MRSASPDQAWTIGEYLVDPTPVESGAFGMVYEARRRSDGHRVALKLVLSTDAPDSADKLAAERRGAELQQQFGRVHGMVPEVYEFGTHLGRHFYIAMEFVEGGSLAHLIAQGPLDPHAAARHAASICAFLEKAHQFLTIEGEAGSAIVHADLKPQHILLPRPGEIRVLDFGIAKALAKTRQVTTNIWGTVYYASPEQLESGGVNPHVDFWSVGVMLYEMVAGHRPYAHLEHDRARLEQAIRTNRRRQPLPDTCPPALAAIINKLLAYQPERRYPNAVAIRADLDAFLGDRTPTAAAEYHIPPTVAIERPPERHRISLESAATSSELTTHNSELQGVLTTPPPLPTLPPPLPAALPPLSLDPVPATEPLPIGHVSSAPMAAPPRTWRTRVRRFRRGVRRLAWLAALLWLVATLALEGVAWVFSEQFRQSLDGIEGPTVTRSKATYDRIDRLSPMDVGLGLRVHRRLRNRLTAIADRVITDYRNEQPSVGLVEWKQAREALRWAQQIAPGDRTIRARSVECDAHVTRIEAQSQPRGSALRQQLFQSALAKFRRAAELDPTSFDPYLGISRTLVYGLDDVDGAAAAIEEAERRGFETSRRERAQLGDGYLRRAEKSRRLARTLSGEQRQRELEKARSDYARCVEMFDPILGFANAAANLELCKRQRDSIPQRLQPEPVLEIVGH